MTLKKKLGSKLAHGVRHVKSQREQNPAVAPAKIAPTVKKSVPQPTAHSATAKSAAPHAAQPQSVTRPVTSPATNLDSLHPRRVWPD